MILKSTALKAVWILGTGSILKSNAPPVAPKFRLVREFVTFQRPIGEEPICSLVWMMVNETTQNEWYTKE